jgi:uncharacterized membrane protein
MPRTGWVPVVLLAAGAIFVADAVLRGTASVTLFAIIPVVSGNSVEFLGGVVLLLVGFLAVPLAFLSWDPPEGAAPLAGARPHDVAPPEEMGGLLLLGPVPIFFGRWKDVSRGTKVAAALVGAVLLVVLALELFFALR